MMMEKLFVNFVLGHRYVCRETNSDVLMHLGLFLEQDVGCYNISNYRQWILDDTIPGFGGDYSRVEKEGKYLLMECDFDHDSPPLKIHRDQLVKILDTWEQFCKTKPKEIIITQNGEVFNIEGRF